MPQKDRSSTGSAVDPNDLVSASSKARKSEHRGLVKKQRLLANGISIRVDDQKWLNDDNDEGLEFDEELGSQASQFTENVSSKAKWLVKNLYPEVIPHPTLQDLTRSILEHDQTDDYDGFWKRGDWVEYLSKDMRWHVGQIRGIVKQAPDEWDWNNPENFDKEPTYFIYYNVGSDTLLPAKNVRATTRALQHLFGKRPWVWQQYALLKIERYVRFQKDHERDFEEVDCVKFANDLFDEWLDHKENKDFRRLYNSFTVDIQERLRGNLITPFELMDEITEDKELWKFTDTDINIYTYFAILGSGGLFTCFCFLLQLCIPVLLLVNALMTSDRFDFEIVSISEFRWESDWKLACTGTGSLLGRLMVMAVVGIYLLTVIPTSFNKFFRNSGQSRTTYSRLSSLRKVVWHQSDDSLSQQIGYKLDRYMNTAYLCILYGIMLLILYTTDSVLDIILNALAAEFVHQVDEQIATTDWWDDENRWLKAGACQLVLQSEIRLRKIANPALFCRTYDIDPEKYAKALGSASDSYLPRLKKHSLARKDDNDASLMSDEDALFHQAGVYSQIKRNEDGIAQFHKTVKAFSVLDRLLNYVRNEKIGVFDMYRAYRTWSRWQKVIFLADVPNFMTLDDIDSVPADEILKYRSSESPLKRFLLDVLSTLIFVRMFEDIANSIRKNASIFRVIFHVFDGLLQWVAFVIQVLFPFVVFAGLFFIPFCY